MKEKFEMFFCENCDGSGYIDYWGKWDSKTENEDKVLEDCDVCNGTGKVRIKVVDKRIKTKGKKAIYQKKI
jgi:hypothetical protein